MAFLKNITTLPNECYPSHKGEILESPQNLRFPYPIYHTKDHGSKVCDSQAGKNRGRKKLQISTDRRVYSKITGLPVILATYHQKAQSVMYPCCQGFAPVPSW